MSELKPPEQWAHLRWHFLTDAHNKIDLCEWVRDVVDASDDTWLKFGDEREFSPAGLYVSGWRYDKPCDPAAITIDAGDEAQVEAVARALHVDDFDGSDYWEQWAEDSSNAAGKHPPFDHWSSTKEDYRRAARGALTALARLGAGT